MFMSMTMITPQNLFEQRQKVHILNCVLAPLVISVTSRYSAVACRRQKATLSARSKRSNISVRRD